MADVWRERKVVTALFVDLAGFTSRSESRDPEDVESELIRYQQRVRAELERFGGTVEKFIGDAVMAVFGAPVAHEDDAERAVRAALAVVAWAATDGGLDVRVGVNTGEALVRVGADAATGETLAIGDVVNTAARLQTAAENNGVLVGEGTFRATRGSVHYDEAEPIVAKGKAERVRAWHARAMSTAVGQRAGLARTDFIGRDHELRMLHEAFARACTDREPQLVTLVGVPGIGKSRLLQEFRGGLEARSDPFTWREGRCLPYGDGVSVWALAEMVKGEAGILESDSPEAAAGKLAETTARLHRDADREWVERRLRPLVGLADAASSAPTRVESFAAWRRFLEAIADLAPTVLVFEDLHWSGDTLLDFIDDFADASADVPLVVVCTGRPELLTNRPGWGGGRTNSLTLSLRPLTDDQTRHMIKRLLEGEPPGGAVADAVLARAGGNPLYAEEFARMVADGARVDEAIPDTVHGIIAARLDALPRAHKRQLQCAAIVGNVFWGGAVAALAGGPREEVDSALRDLERRQLVRRRRDSAVAEDVEWSFVHILARDVCYGQITRPDRSVGHRRAAEWIAALGRGDDHAELLAYHYLAALEHARAAGLDVADLVEPARRAVRDAAERASMLNAHDVAARLFGAALDLTEDSAERAHLFNARATAHWWASATDADQLAEAVRQLEAVGDREAAGETAMLFARAEWMAGRRESADQWLREAGRYLDSAPDSPAALTTLLVHAGFSMVRGEFGAAAAGIESALERIDRSGQADLRARARDILGVSRVGLGDPAGLETSREAVTIAREARSIRAWQVALNNMCEELLLLGRLRELPGVLAERRQVFEQFGGTAETRTWLSEWEVIADFFAGAWDEVITGANRLLETMAAGGTHVLQVNQLPMRAKVRSAREWDFDPRPDLDTALDVARSAGAQPNLAGCLVWRADILLDLGAAAEADVAFSEVLRLSPDIVWPENETARFASVALRLGRIEDASAVLARSLDRDWTAAARHILQRQFGAAADLLTSIGDLPGAAAAGLLAGGGHRERAVEFYRSVGAERLLAASPTG